MRKYRVKVETLATGDNNRTEHVGYVTGVRKNGGLEGFWYVTPNVDRCAPVTYEAAVEASKLVQEYFDWHGNWMGPVFAHPEELEGLSES